MKSFAELAFTPAVQALQSANGSRAAYARMQAAGAPGGLGAGDAAFLERADSFYLATVSETGWPYVQHRGGPRGFLLVGENAPDMPAYVLPGNNYHVFDYALFWANTRTDAAARLAAFLRR